MDEGVGEHLGDCEACGHRWYFHFSLIVPEQHPFGEPHPRQPCSFPELIIAKNGNIRGIHYCYCTAEREPVYVPGRTLNTTGKALQR